MNELHDLPKNYLEEISLFNPNIHSKILLGLNEDNIKTAVDNINDGKIGIFYCGSSYAIGVNAFNLEGVNRIYKIKKRDTKKPLSILASKNNINKWAQIDNSNSKYIEKIISKYWPGPISIVVNKKYENNKFNIPEYVTSGQATVHLVCIDSYTELMSLYSECPVAVTSANLSGEDLITNPIDAIKKFGNDVDFFLIGPESQYKYSTTIIDFSQNPPQLLRNSSQTIVQNLKDYLKIKFKGDD